MRSKKEDAKVKPMTICAFGNYDPKGGRHWVIRTGLKEAGFDFVDCNTQVKGFFKKYLDLKRKWKECRSEANFIYVVFFGHYLMPLAWILAKKNRIPLIMDAFLSIYDTEVHDRKRVSRLNPKAWVLWFTDFIACLLADKVLIDTEEHKEYFQKTFFVKKKKMIVIPIGCRTDLFKPKSDHESDPKGVPLGDKWTVEFHGTFIPLQGIETILGAAKELEDEDIYFRIIGKGQTYDQMYKKAQELNLPKVEFTGSKPMEEIPSEINRADVCLGIFGTTSKAKRVVPTKAYEILNCGKPLITGKTPASNRILISDENAILTEPGSSKELAEAILRFRNDPNLAERIANNGQELSLKHFQPTTIVTPLLEWLRRKSSSPASRDS